LELRDIEYFSVIAEHKHLGRAAEALGLGVPAVSKSLRRLEVAAGARLVTRTTKGVALTAEGVALLSHIRGLRLSIRDITRQLADLRQGHAGDVRVGAGAGHAEYLLPAACKALHASGANINVTVFVGSSDVTIPALLQGDLDLIVTQPEAAADARLMHEHLYEAKIVVAAASDNPLAGRKSLKLADLAGEKWAVATNDTRKKLGELFRARSLPPPHIALSANSAWLRMRTVAISRIIGVFSLPATFVFPDARSSLKILPIKDLKWTRAVCVAYRRSAYLSPAASRLIEQLRTEASAPLDQKCQTHVHAA
jgi:DNA-binding transcriptional LysR family regulator